MSLWRRKAVEMFPELKKDFQVGEKSSYSVFLTLRGLLWDALETNDEDTITKIFQFAEWCSRQKAENLWNAAGVSFYEHIFDEWKYRQKVIAWLSPLVITSYKALWEGRLSSERVREVNQLIAQRTDHFYRTKFLAPDLAAGEAGDIQR